MLRQPVHQGQICRILFEPRTRRAYVQISPQPRGEEDGRSVALRVVQRRNDPRRRSDALVLVAECRQCVHRWLRHGILKPSSRVRVCQIAEGRLQDCELRRDCRATMDRRRGCPLAVESVGPIWPEGVDAMMSAPIVAAARLSASVDMANVLLVWPSRPSPRRLPVAGGRSRTVGRGQSVVLDATMCAPAAVSSSILGHRQSARRYVKILACYRELSV